MTVVEPEYSGYDIALIGLVLFIGIFCSEYVLMGGVLL